MTDLNASADPDLSVVLPVYNEADTLPPVVRELRDVLGSAQLGSEIILVNDGSNDRTDAVARDLVCQPGVPLRVVHHPVNRGYGAALTSGFGASRGRWVAFLDGDGQMVASDVPRLLAAARRRRLDVAIGYRAHRCDPLWRRLNARMWGVLVGLSLGVWVRDVDCALKVIRGDLVRRLPLESRGAAINAELLWRLRELDARVGEFPVGHRPRSAGRATGSRPGVVLRALHELAHLARQRRLGGRTRLAHQAGHLS
jgi:glycosyltransferase involved in cell wall biosynthesis